MADGTTIMLAVLATVLVLYVVQQDRSMSKTSLGKKKKPSASLGSASAPKNLGNAQQNAMACDNVSIDSPDFERCATTLGAGRSVIRSQPTANRINSSFVKDSFNALGNPFAVKLDDSFTKDTNKKLGAQAFPFSQSGALPKNGADGAESYVSPKTGSSTKLVAPKEGVRGQKFERGHGMRAKTGKVEAPARGSSRSSVTVGSTMDRGVKFQSLGAAVSPSSLGASPAEMTNFSHKLDNVDSVASNTGGNLNLLHPL